MNFKKKPFQFSAIVGQEKIKTAYLANIVNPNIGGLLISGPKGTGKSTIVHSVDSILPKYNAVDGCDFNCDPDAPQKFCSNCNELSEILPINKKMRIVNLPLSCTEDRLLGCVDIETLLKTGTKKIQVGILGEANRNILYVDEVNLLPDHLVDDILDAAASPWNTIERDGISITHPAEFILIGTMNPEEGELRPQILDRFALCIKAESIHDPAQRVEIVKRTLMYENNPDKFIRNFENEEATLKTVISKARKILNKVMIDEEFLIVVAEANAKLKVDGQRPDIVIVKTAQTIAALDERTIVDEKDVLLSAELALSHRTRDGGLLEPPTPDEIIEAFSPSLKKRNIKSESSKKKFVNTSGSLDKDVDKFIDRENLTSSEKSADDSETEKKK